MGVFIPRAVDSTGLTIDFLLSAKRDAAATERFLTKSLDGKNHPVPRVINTDKHAAYPPAILELKAGGVLEEKCRHLRKGQACWSAKVGLLHRFIFGLFAATN